MTRIARVVSIGYPHHVVQRGNNKERIFFEHTDRERYLLLLKKYSDKTKSPILAYCLMTNHVHLLVRPKAEGSLSQMMHGMASCYAQFVNNKYTRTGHLWENRYYSCIVDNESYLWAVARYIEQNPRRAKLVEQEEDYCYSSARAHLGIIKDDILGEELFSDKQRKEYEQFLHESMPEAEIKAIRRTARIGQPLGSQNFIEKMERQLHRKLNFNPRGRPSKVK